MQCRGSGRTILDVKQSTNKPVFCIFFPVISDLGSAPRLDTSLDSLTSARSCLPSLENDIMAGRFWLLPGLQIKIIGILGHTIELCKCGVWCVVCGVVWWSIKISTGVSVGAGLSLHRHQANFSRVFDIYFGRYYWNIFTLFPQNIFLFSNFPSRLLPPGNTKTMQCFESLASVTLNIETWRKVQFANFRNISCWNWKSSWTTNIAGTPIWKSW